MLIFKAFYINDTLISIGIVGFAEFVGFVKSAGFEELTI